MALPIHTARTRQGSIATPHLLATKAGEQAYLAGGNAIDAALAAATVLAVVYPHNTTLGGDSVSLVHAPDGSVTCVNSTGYAPAAVSREELALTHGGTLPIRGADTITVPGAVRGWGALRSLGARLNWEDQFSNAIEHASSGVPVAPSLARLLAKSPFVFDDAGLRGVFAPGGVLLAQGDRLHQPALADSLRTLRSEGESALYGGSIGQALVAGLQARGSRMTIADLEQFQTEFVAPLTADVAGLTVFTSPPNTQGFGLLRILSALEVLQQEHPLDGGAAVLARLFGQANVLRDTVLADPRLAVVDVASLVDGTAAARGAAASAASKPIFDINLPKGDTIGIAAVDSDGYAVSLIQSIYHLLGSGILEPTTGIIMQNRGMSFSLDATSENRIEGHKRPSHTLMPVMVGNATGLRWVNATMGGKAQPQIHAQLILKQRAGATSLETVSAPRFVVGARVPGDTDDAVYAEEDLSPAALDAFAQSGMTTTLLPPYTEALGHANVIACLPDGSFDAASDPRADGGAVVVDLPAL